MKNLFSERNKTLRALTALALIFVFSHSTVFAAPTKTLSGGTTTVELSSDFTSAAASLGLSVKALRPARTPGETDSLGDRCGQTSGRR